MVAGCRFCLLSEYSVDEVRGCQQVYLLAYDWVYDFFLVSKLANMLIVQNKKRSPLCRTPLSYYPPLLPGEVIGVDGRELGVETGVLAGRCTGVDTGLLLGGGVYFGSVLTGSVLIGCVLTGSVLTGSV